MAENVVLGDVSGVVICEPDMYVTSNPVFSCVLTDALFPFVISTAFGMKNLSEMTISLGVDLISRS